MHVFRWLVSNYSFRFLIIQLFNKLLIDTYGTKMISNIVWTIRDSTLSIRVVKEISYMSKLLDFMGRCLLSQAVNLNKEIILIYFYGGNKTIILTCLTKISRCVCILIFNYRQKIVIHSINQLPKATSETNLIKITI